MSGTWVRRLMVKFLLRSSADTTPTEARARRDTECLILVITVKNVGK